MKKLVVFVGLGIITAVVIGGCSKSAVGPGLSAKYHVEAMLVENLAGYTARIDVALTKNDSLYKKAIVTLAAVPLDTVSIGYYKTFDTTVIKPGHSYVLNIKDSTSLNYNITISVPAILTGQVTNLPVNRLYSGGMVTVQWTVATGADGYIYATTTPPGSISDSGYQVYAAGTDGAIPPDAFKLNQVPISGTHKVYIAAYTGAPVSAPGVPFAIPVANNPADNISTTIITGRAAGMVVALPDSVVVP